MGGSERGFDVLVVTVSSDASRRWWTERLHAGRESVAGRAEVAVVVEPRPAGTAGGTVLAVRAAGEALGTDLLAPSDRSVAVVHAAGAGTRLEPLTSIEGEKPRVRVPGVARIDGRDVAITLLEAVIRSTAAWGPASRGRIAVWWGDQVFAAPSASWGPAHPASLLVRAVEAPDDAAWSAQGLHRYGVVALDGTVAHVEKADRAGFVRAIGRDPARVAQSLGVFCVDPALLSALARVSHPEIAAGERLSTDRDWWMALTLPVDGFIEASIAAGRRSAADARAWHDRLAPIRDRFGPVLGAAPIDGPWWDFGTLATWEQNVRRVTEDGPDADALRTVLGSERLPADHPLDPEGRSVLVASRVGGGRLSSSVVIGCDLDEADLTDAIRVGVHATRDEGTGLAYSRT